MAQLVNVLLAWLATGCTVACGIVWGLKAVAKWDLPIGAWSLKWNKLLRKSHIFLGVMAVQTGLFHGLLSSESVFSFNIGTLLWVFTILIGLTFMWRKKLAKWRGWLYWHRILTVAIGLLIVIHVVDVGGITIHQVVLETIMPQKMTVESSQLADNEEETKTVSEESASALEEVTVESTVETKEANAQKTTLPRENSKTTPQTGVKTEVIPQVKTQVKPQVKTQIKTQTQAAVQPEVQNIAKTVVVNEVQNKVQPATPATPATPARETQTTQSQGIYKDGVYTGEAVGYRPGLVVEVTVKNGRIADIQVVSHNEKGQRFYGPPIATIPPAIIESQSTQVDTVSGATYTSKGIMDAVENALKAAK